MNFGRISRWRQSLRRSPFFANKLEIDDAEFQKIQDEWLVWSVRTVEEREAIEHDRESNENKLPFSKLVPQSEAIETWIMSAASTATEYFELRETRTMSEIAKYIGIKRAMTIQKREE